MKVAKLNKNTIKIDFYKVSASEHRSNRVVYMIKKDVFNHIENNFNYYYLNSDDYEGADFDVINNNGLFRLKNGLEHVYLTGCLDAGNWQFVGASDTIEPKRITNLIEHIIRKDQVVIEKSDSAKSIIVIDSWYDDYYWTIWSTEVKFLDDIISKFS